MTASEQDAYELVDNDEYGRHRDALQWLAAQHERSPLAVATGYMSLDGLDALAQVEEPVRLLIGVAPAEGALTGSSEPVTRDRFEESVSVLRRERDFSGFPASRRAMLERVGAFIASDGAEVRRYTQRFLHGKAYIFGRLTEAGGLDGRGAALVTSANLTAGGLASNLELGMVHYQPTVVTKALQWHRRLWDEAEDFRDELLDLLRPPPLEVTAEDVFLRALLELYGDAPPPEPVAANALTAFQRDGLARARMIMDRYGGVLYADGVGMGKTEIGLDLIREHEKEYGYHVLVVASAQLRDSIWQPRIKQANLAATVVSYQQLAQEEQLGGERSVLDVGVDNFRLVIVDEAHAYRNSDTTWYAALSRLMSGPDKKMALLTATPVNNTLWDLHNLFLLFGRHDAAFADTSLRIVSLQQFFRDAGATRAGDERDQAPSPARLFPLLDALTVRRDRVFIRKHYAGERLADGTEVKFPEPRLYERRYSLNKAYQGMAREIADRIGPPLEGEAPRPGALTMAQYRPASYRKDPGTEAARQEALAGLMLSLLLKRFESSWYAALKTVERMRRHALVRIRYLEGERDESPPVEDKDADQLDGLDKAALDLLEDPGDWENPQEFSDELLEALRRDADTLGGLAERIGRLKGRPDPKLDALREVMAETEAQKVVVFTSFRDTAEYLRRAFEDDPDLLNGREWAAVVGSEVSETDRERAIDRFCPDLATVPRKDADQYGEIDVLLSTDLLSEGQNLQQAQAVLSYDMPWNPQRVVQRNGRVIRLRSPHETALLYTLMPEDAELTELLGLEARLQAKIQAANASIGMDAPVLATEKSESRIFEGLTDYMARLSGGDASLLDEDGGPGGAVSAGEEYRRKVERAVSEGDAKRVQEMPWGIGAAIARAAGEIDQPAVFFACRTRDCRRYWRMVSASGTILYRDDLPMLRLIDPTDQEQRTIPSDLDLERLFAVAAADICEEHNKPVEKPKPPASQRWALKDILPAAGAPQGADYNHAADILSAPQSTPVRRALSELRREYGQGGMSLLDCAARILDVVERFRLRPITFPAQPARITSEDIGVVCYQVVLPQGDISPPPS